MLDHVETGDEVEAVVWPREPFDATHAQLGVSAPTPRGLDCVSAYIHPSHIAVAPKDGERLTGSTTGV
jgi:hypothetical protein